MVQRMKVLSKEQPMDQVKNKPKTRSELNKELVFSQDWSEAMEEKIDVEPNTGQVMVISVEKNTEQGNIEATETNDIYEEILVDPP